MTATYSLMAIIERAEISRIDRICDHDPDGVSVHHWFDVHLEVPDNKMVQTMQMTVNHDALDDFLVMHGWTFESDWIKDWHQGYGCPMYGEYR
jgi:hypothetical protein